MKSILLVLLVVGAIFCGLSLQVHFIHKHENLIVKWCADQGQSVEKVEFTMIRSGPYWRRRGDFIYRAETESEHGREVTYWFCFRGFYSTTAQRENPDGSYTELPFDE